MYPRRVVAWNAKFPGEVLRLYLILKASRMLQVKKGTQHTRKLTKSKIMNNYKTLIQQEHFTKNNC